MLLHLQLLRVRKLRNHGSDLRSRAATAGGNQNQKLHYVIIDLRGPALDDVDVLISHRDTNLHRSLTIGELLERARRRADTQPVTHKLAQLWVGQTDKHFTFPHDAIGLSLGGGTGDRQRGYESRKGETLREGILWRLPSLTLRGELIFFFFPFVGVNSLSCLWDWRWVSI
uniref:Uncharacterized protein n=1 Tax=Candidozyma auris TaxID=498019 RepID=A0A0L0NRQ5_CANAR